MKIMKNLLYIILILSIVTMQISPTVRFQESVADCLRPAGMACTPAILSLKTEIADNCGLAQKSSSSGKMLTLSGDGTNPEKTVTGATIATYSHYPAKMLVESIPNSKIPSEIEFLKILIEKIEAGMMKKYIGNKQLTSWKKVLWNHFHQIDDYYKQCLEQNESERPILSCVSYLKYLLKQSLDDAQFFYDSEKETAINKILESLEKEVVKGMHSELINRSFFLETHSEDEYGCEKRRRAEAEWNQFLDVGKKVIETYKRFSQNKEEELESAQTIEQLTMAKIKRFWKKKKDLSSSDDNVNEKKELSKRIKKNIGLLRICRQDIRNIFQIKAAYDLYEVMFNDIKENHIKGPENLSEKNKTITSILYDEIYCVADNNKNDISDKKAQVYAANIEIMRFCESLISYMKKVEPYYLDMPKEREIIIFTDTEIGVEALHRLIKKAEDQNYSIKGIVSLEGTPSSHWVIEAVQKNIPVVILNQEESVKNFIRTGDKVILKTLEENAVGKIIINPDEQTERYETSEQFKQECEHALYVSETKKLLQSDLTAANRYSIYANISDSTDIETAVQNGAKGIELFRTEVALSRYSEILKSYIEFAKNGDIHNKCLKRNEFLRAYLKDLIINFILFNAQTGIFVIRTFDFEEDKAMDILSAIPDTQHKMGFDFYQNCVIGNGDKKTEIGKEFLIIQLTAIFQALYIASRAKGTIFSNDITMFLDGLNIEGKGEGIRFNPIISFPMVEEESQMQWVYDDILPKALFNALAGLERICPSDREEIKEILSNYHLDRQLPIEYLDKIIGNGKRIEIGAMLETFKMAINIEPFLYTKGYFPPAVFNIGTNDLTQAILAEIFLRKYNIDIKGKVSRNDRNYGRYFTELRHEVLEYIVKCARDISSYNKEHRQREVLLGCCGQIASRKKMVIFALYLEDEFKLKVDLGVPPESVPELEFFKRFVRKEDLSVIRNLVNFDKDGNVNIAHTIDSKSEELVKIITDRIKKSKIYMQEVISKVDKYRDLLPTTYEEQIFSEDIASISKDGLPLPVSLQKDPLVEVSIISQAA